MMTAHDTADRRHATRDTETNRRIGWVRVGKDTTHAGWVKDMAADGIAFITPIRDQPRIGDALDVTVDAYGQRPECHRVHVKRVSSFDGFFTLVACEFDRESASSLFGAVNHG